MWRIVCSNKVIFNYIKFFQEKNKMISLREYIHENNQENEYLDILCETISEDIIEDSYINESFKIDILNKLSAQIKEFEGEHRQRDKETVQRYKDQGYSGRPTPTEKTFKSLFGPIVQTDKFGPTGKKLRGCRWSELTDSDVTYYENGFEGTLHKRIKQMWNGKIRGLILGCDPDTHKIMFAVRGYRSTDKYGKLLKPTVFMFRVNVNKSTGGVHKSLNAIEVDAYKYSSRKYKADEFIELINDLEVYFIEIPDSAVTDYYTLTNDRTKSQKGVVNYDDESLKKLAQEQRARYKQLAKELRAKRIENDPEYLFNEITKINDTVIDLYRRVIRKPEYSELYYVVGDLMNYVSDAFREYASYISNMKIANDSIAKARELGTNNPEGRGEYHRGEYHRDDAVNNVEDIKRTLDRINSNIKEIEDRMK